MNWLIAGNYWSQYKACSVCSQKKTNWSTIAYHKMSFWMKKNHDFVCGVFAISLGWNNFFFCVQIHETRQNYEKNETKISFVIYLFIGSSTIALLSRTNFTSTCTYTDAHTHTSYRIHIRLHTIDESWRCFTLTCKHQSTFNRTTQPSNAEQR